MLNGLFRQQRLRLPLNTALERRPDKVVEEEGSIHEQRKAKHLEPLERLPAKSKRDNPDKQGAGSINGRARGCRDGAGDAKAKEVETTAVFVNTWSRTGRYTGLTQY